MRVLVVVLALAGCYKPSAVDCAYKCGAGNACPSGLTCNGGFCASAGTTCSDADVDPCEAPFESCGGACVDTTSSAQHCGMCNRACGGAATCTGGTCSVETLRESLYAPGELAAGFGHVVYIEGKFTACASASSKLTLLESANPASAKYEIAITDNNCPGALAVAQNAFYVGRLGDVRRFRFDSSSADGSFDAGQYIGGIAVNETRVFFGTHGSNLVYSAPLNLATPTTIHMTTNRKVQDLVLTPTRLWFETSTDADPERQIDVIDHAGLNDQLDVVRALNNALLAYGNLRVFVGERAGSGGGIGAIVSFHHDTSSPSSFLDSSGGIYALAADDDAVYWAEEVGTGSTIWMRPHGGSTSQMLATQQPPIRDLALDPPYLYWLSDTNSANGVLRRMRVK